MIKNIVAFCILSLFIVACSKDDNNSSEAVDRTVLVYMAADNSLSENVAANVDSMASGYAKSANVGNLIVYLDNKYEVPVLIEFVKDKRGIVTQKTVKTYPEQNSCSPTVMSNVLSDVISLYPSVSNSYGLILWSHGTGWLPSPANSKATTTKWFGQDDSNYMDISDLVSALNTVPHFDFILFDACFMGGVEVAYALRNNADYLIASPTEILEFGFPYGDIITPIFAEGQPDHQKIASLFYDHYNALASYNQSASVGVVKCDELESLAAETNKLITTHVDQLNNISTSGIQYLECYSPHEFYDFGGFIESFTTEEERIGFEVQLNKTVLYKASTPKILSVLSSSYYELIPISNFCGINTYIPQNNTSSLNTSYKSYEWYTASGLAKTAW